MIESSFVSPHLLASVALPGETRGVQPTGAFTLTLQSMQVCLQKLSLKQANFRYTETGLLALC